MAAQLSFSGEAVPVRNRPTPFGTVRDRMQDILERDKPSRNSKRRAMFLYWRKWDGLDAAVGNIDALWHWWMHTATPPKTLDERLREVVRQHPALGPSPSVAARRRRQSVRRDVL